MLQIAFTTAEAFLDNGDYINALTTLNTIIPQNNAEQYLLDVYKIQIAGLLDSAYSYTSSEMDNLYAIASECELGSGPAVRKARALYNNITNAYTPFENECTENGGARLSRSEKTGDNTKFNLYPNPSSGELTFEFDYIKENDEATVMIYSLDGKLLDTINLPLYSKLVKFSLREYQNGVYVCKLVKNGTNLMTERLVIMK